MEESARQKLNSLPVRARVALALGCAERASENLEVNAQLYALAQQALRAAWGWEFGEPVSSRELYEYIHPLLAFESGLATNRKQLDALLSVVSAIYYVTWKADGLERRARVASRDKNLPNDVAEVDEDTVAQSLDYAARSAGDESEARWQQEAINKLHADFAVEDMNELGERVSPEYFRGIDRS